MLSSVNSFEQMTESHHITQKTSSPLSPTKMFEKQISTPLSSSSSPTSSCPSVSSTTSPQSIGLGINLTKSFITHINEHSLSETFKSKTNRVLQDSITGGVQDTTTLNSNPYMLSNFPSVCFGMPNESLLNQIANSYGTNVFPISTSFSPNDLCINKFPNSLVRSWTEGCAATNLTLNTSTVTTNSINPTVNISRNNCINHVISGIDADNNMFLRSHSSGISSININESKSLISAPYDNLTPTGIMNSFHSIDKLNLVLPENENHANNLFSGFDSYTDLTKSRNSTGTTTNAFNNSSSNGNPRKTDEDFCDLCQKHFCNKYYLRKHKTDVHGIHTEPYSHSRRRASETQSVNNSNQIKNGNLSLANNNISTATTTDFVHNAPFDVDNTLQMINPMFHSDSSKIKDKLKGIDFSTDFGKSQLTDLHSDLIKTQSPTKCESSNKSLSNIYDYMNCASSALFPSYVSEITNGKLYGNDEVSHSNKNFVGTTHTSISSANNPIISNVCSNNVDQLISVSESNGILNETNATYHIPTYDVTTSCNHIDMSKDESQKSIIDSLRIQSNGLNPLLSAQHYYMMALAANFPSSSNSLFSPPEVLAKSNFMQTFSTSLDIPFLSVPPPDLNNITLQEAQCDQCQKVFCNEYFLQLHSLSHQNNLNESTLRNEKERLNVMENVSTEKEDIDKLNKKDSNTDKSNMDIEANDNGDCDSQRNNQEKTKKKETDSFLFLLNKSNNSDVNMKYLENSELRLNTHSLDAFKSSMVAAKLADRVTCELCNKELCNKYFLRTHKIRVHGISPKEVGGPPMRNPPTIENSTFSCSLNDLHATNCITNSHEINSMLNFGENGKMETALSDDMLNSFNSAYSTLGLVNQFLPFAYWPFFAACNFMPEQAGSYPLDKSLLSNLDNVATWNNLNSSIMNDICSYTSPTISNNSNKNPDLTEIPSAITSICCPLCDLPIGPRLFLPTHLSSVHKLSPTDPDFFMNMLRAKPLSKTEKVTDTKVFDHWPSINPKSINVGFQEECTMNNIHQPDIADLAKGCISSSDKNKEQIDVNNCPDNLILKEFKSYGQKMELKAISNESTSITSDIMNVKSMDIDLHAETMKSQPISSKELSSNDITQYLSTNTSSMNSISFLPVNQVNTLETTINDSHTTGLSLAPVSSTISSRDSLINYASTTTSSFSSLPINPIASMTEVSATGDPISSRSWNMMTHLSINNHSNNQSTMNQLSAEVSPTSSLGNISNSVAQSSIPRKSPNQMRVLCDICNKWICNKYFLRTHKANKHGVTDLSLGSLENHRSGIEKSVTTMKSNIHTSFRRAMNHYVRGSSQGDDKVINNYSNSNRKLNSPCDSQVSFRNSCMTSKQERQTHNTEQIITNNDFLTGTSLTNISATTDISGTINSLPLSFQTTVATHLPWLSYGFPHQPTSLVSYPTMNYPSILSFPMIPNSDIYPYSQMDIAEKLETTESNVHNSESNKISADTESENEENKNPLNLSLKITLEDQKSSCCFTTSNTPNSTTTIVNDNNNNNNSSTTNKSNKPLEINMVNNKITWLKQGQIIKNYLKNQYFSSFCNLHVYNRFHRKSNQLLLSLQLKRKSIQFIRKKICLNRKIDVDKHTKEIEDSQINLPANTCETQQNNTKNIATSPQYSMDRFRKTSNYHHQLNRLQRKKHRKMKTTKSYYVTTETPSKQFYSQTTHKDIINNACNLYNEIQLHENNPSMNDENCPTEINKSKSIFPTKLFCPLCLNGNVFIEYIEFIKHLKENHSILEYEPVMKLLKTQMEFYNPQSYIFQTNNSITTSKSIKPDTYDYNIHVSSINNVATTVSLALEGSNTVINNNDFSSVPISHNDIIYDFQENNNMNSASSSKSIDLTSTVVCQSSMALLPFTSCSSSASLSFSSSISVTNSMVSTPRTLGRPLFMPINSFTKTLSTI